jgi:hypothetical protein
VIGKYAPEVGLDLQPFGYRRQVRVGVVCFQWSREERPGVFGVPEAHNLVKNLVSNGIASDGGADVLPVRVSPRSVTSKRRPSAKGAFT